MFPFSVGLFEPDAPQATQIFEFDGDEAALKRLADYLDDKLVGLWASRVRIYRPASPEATTAPAIVVRLTADGLVEARGVLEQVTLSWPNLS